MNDTYFIAQNALLQVVYEKNKDENPAAPLWRYRSRITIEHLEFFIDQQSKSENECPVLKEFLKEVTASIYVSYNNVYILCYVYIGSETQGNTIFTRYNSAAENTL